MIKNIFIFGASSAIAQETAKFFCEDKCNFFLVAQDLNKLNIIQKDLMTRGAGSVYIKECDALDYSKHSTIFYEAIKELGEIDTILIAHGTLPENEQIRNKNIEVIKQFEINCNSVISLCSVASEYFEKYQKGTIAVISSVAGERGRQSNFIYGAAKGAVSIYLQGLRNRLFEMGIKVITIKPGMVDTPMTKDFKKGFLFSSPKKVGKDIYLGIKKGRDIIYTPSYWKYIMFIIKSIPESIFKKLKL